MVRKAEGMTEDEGEPTVPPAPDGRFRVGAVVAATVLLVLGGLGAAYLLSRPEPAGPGHVEVPADAPVGEFCQTYAEVVAVRDGRSVHQWADAMAKVGTPEGLSTDGRAGFELVLGATDDVDEDATLGDLKRQETEFGEPEAAKVEAFTDFATTTCVNELQQALLKATPSGLPS
jgi:hypothetical protein